MSALLFGCSSEGPSSISDSQIKHVLVSANDDADLKPKRMPEIGLKVVIGPTTIPQGDAQGEQDITVSNGYFAVAFAADTASPWGVAKGGILDAAVKSNGALQSDFVSLVDFMPNYWSAWPSTYQTTEVIEQTESVVVVRTKRDWGAAVLQTDFEISADSNLIKLRTSMTNPSEQALESLTTGYIAWPTGGHLFGMPGLTEGDSKPIPDQAAFANWSASYDQNWALGLHSNFSDHVAYTGRDRYLKHSLKPQQSREFVAWLQIEPNADLAKFSAVDIARNQRAAGTLSGTILDRSGQAIANSVVVVKKDKKLHSWSLSPDGNFEFLLPEGDYEVFATAQNHGPGSVQSVSISAQKPVAIALDKVRAPGKIEFNVIDQDSATPMDAMISVIKGTKPIVGYFGKSRYFTQLSPQGSVELAIAPGDYQFEISSAGSFFSSVSRVQAAVEPNATASLTIPIKTIQNPSLRGWYNADLHHHSDVLDGFTNPEFVLRSQLAAGVNMPFLSDHDSVINNMAMRDLAASRGLEFIPGTELSASWGHFNAYPIDYDLVPGPNIGSQSVQKIYQEARRLGADVIHVNHPFGNYGYFDSLDQEVEDGLPANSIVPGGYDLGFDLIEITTEHEPKTLQRAWQLWNDGKPAYFAAGSDVHDVWNTLPEHSSGAARSFVYIDGDKKPTQAAFVSALKAGHSYASQGPIMYPELSFGSELVVPANKLLNLNYQVQSVVGLKAVQLIERGQVIDELAFSASSNDSSPRKVEFQVTPYNDTWYSLVVSDVAGNHAYSNPLWVKTDKN